MHASPIPSTSGNAEHLHIHLSATVDFPGIDPTISIISKDQSVKSNHTADSSKKRKSPQECKTKDNFADHTVDFDIFQFLAPSDLVLTPKALIETHISHFRCNLNGCKRHYRSHTALARHRREKHSEWPSHQAHSNQDECALRQQCADGHCGSEHECVQSSHQSQISQSSMTIDFGTCSGAMPHCHAGERWPPDGKSVFKCPEPQCDHAAAQVQSLRYHYLRTHGGVNQSRFPCPSCGKTFALKTDRNRHAASCSLGFRCECGKLLRTAEGLETHRRIFHRQTVPHLPETPAVSEAFGQSPKQSASRIVYELATGNVSAVGGSEGMLRVVAAAVGKRRGDGAGATVPHSNGGGGEDLDDLLAHMDWLLPSDFYLPEHALLSPRREGGLFLCGFVAGTGDGDRGGCMLRFRNLAELAWHRRGHEKDGWIRATVLLSASGAGSEEWPPKRSTRFPCPRGLLDGCQARFGYVKQVRAHLLRAHRDVLPLSRLAAVAAAQALPNPPSAAAVAAAAAAASWAGLQEAVGLTEAQ